MSRRRIVSSHAPVKVAAHLLRLYGGNYDIAPPECVRRRAAEEIGSLPQRAAFLAARCSASLMDVMKARQRQSFDSRTLHSTKPFSAQVNTCQSRGLCQSCLCSSSVVTDSPLPSIAARRVCQERLAHLTRAGNSRTPAKIFSRPR